MDQSLERSSAGFCVRTSLMFLVFINDLYQGIASNILKLADDTKIFKEVSHMLDCEALQRDLDNVVLWAQKWQIEFNVKWLKSVKLCMLGDRMIVVSTGYYMGGSKLVEEALEKDLGVWISADMKCSQQCRYAVNKAIARY